MLIKLLGIGLATLLLAGCLGGAGTSTTGTLALHLGDSGAGQGEINSLALQALEDSDLELDEVDELWITFESIQVKPENGGWDTVYTAENDGKSVDVMDLRGQSLLLGEGQVPPGTYTHVRVTTSSAEDAHRVVLAARPNDPEPLKIPSNELKFQNVNIFVPGNGVTQLFLDVNPHYLILRGQSGKGYNLNPVQAIRLLPMSELGIVTLNWELPWTEGESYSLSLAVFAGEPKDEDDPFLTLDLEENATTVTLSGMSPGNYTFVLTAPDHDDSWKLYGTKTVEADGDHKLILDSPNSSDSDEQ